MRFTKQIKSHRAPFAKAGHSNIAFPTSWKWAQASWGTRQVPTTQPPMPSPRWDCCSLGGTPCQAEPPKSPGLSLHPTCPATDSLCQVDKVGEKREGCFPAGNSWLEDGASLLQINLIFPCPKIALRSISSPALQHWLCPAPVLSPGQLCK